MQRGAQRASVSSAATAAVDGRCNGQSLAALRDELEPFVARPLRSALRCEAQDLAALVALIAATAVLAPTGGPARHLAVLAAAFGAGLVGTNLFMIAHDAAHGSYTHLPRLNRFLARLNLLLVLHPPGPWRHLHHEVHHISTNELAIDVVWRPLSPDAWRELGPVSRALHRAYRTTPGFGLYYAIELWGREMMAVAPLTSPPAGMWRDRAAVAAAAGGWALLGGWLDGIIGAVLMVVIPFAVVTWAIGFVVYFNHTHPDVAWGHAEGWSTDDAQFAATVHLVYPQPLAFFLGNIMEHAAHHVHPGVPLGNLDRAQARLAELLDDRIVTQRWSPSAHRRIVRTCRLWHEQRQAWCDWDGTVLQAIGAGRKRTEGPAQA